MARIHQNPVLHHIRSLALRSAPPQSDVHLLEQYVSDRDEDAFATLLHRYGRLVRSVCRHVLRREQDIDDAFQATFLVFASKAASIQKSTSLASWLYGVAYRCAMNARRGRLHRKEEQREPTGYTTAEPAATASLREIQAILDAEVQALPEKYRAPFVLCCLEGKTQPEAAHELSWPEGTVSSRLARARAKLRSRLRARGIALTAALCAVEISRTAASAAVPSALVNGTLKAAATLAVGPSCAKETISGEVARLTGSVLRGLVATKLKTGVAVLLCVGMLASAGLLAHRLMAATDEQPLVVLGQGLPEQPVPVAKGTGKQPAADLHGDPLPDGAVSRLGTVCFRLETYAHLAAYAPDSKTVLSISGESYASARKLYSSTWIAVWDVHSGKRLRRFGGEHELSCAALSPDHKLAATAGYRGPIILWDVAAGRKARQIEAAGSGVEALAFSPDGQVLASVGPGQPTRLWRVDTGQVLRQLHDQATDASAVAFSLDRKLLATGGKQGRVQLWEADTGRLVRDWAEGYADQIRALVFSPDSQLLACCPENNKIIRVRQVSTNKEVHRFAVTSATGCLAFAPDGSTLAAGAFLPHRCGIRQWDLRSGKERRPLAGHFFRVESLAYSADGRRLVSGGVDNAIRLWDPVTGAELSPTSDPFSWITSFSFTKDGRQLITSGMDGTIRLWEPTTGKELRQLQGHTDRVWRITLAADGRTLASASHDGTVRIWELSTGKELRRFQDHKRGVVTLALSSDGRWLATGEHLGTMHIWDAQTGKEVHRLGTEGLKHPAAFTFSPDSQLLAGLIEQPGNPEQTLLTVWSSATGKEVRHWTIPEDSGPPLFAPDGRSLVLVGEGATPFTIYDLATGKQRATRDLLPWMGTPAASVFSPDGRMMLTREGESILCLREVASGNVRRRFVGHQNRINAMAFSPDGRLAVSSSTDATALVWTVQPSGQPLTAEDVEAAWERLAANDAARAYEAMGRLLASPSEAVALLKQRLAPVVATEQTVLDRLLRDLDSDRFAVRRKAAAELMELGELAEPTLRKAAATPNSLEVRRRIDQLLAKLESGPLPARQLREVRAIEVLEHLATPAARQLLEKLATGAPAARLTREAKASVSRLAR
jgi:RNA polymerase sigma factor (sigma-70 family)